jgi:hypothetical protein
MDLLANVGLSRAIADRGFMSGPNGIRRRDWADPATLVSAYNVVLLQADVGLIQQPAHKPARLYVFESRQDVFSGRRPYWIWLAL